MANAHKKYGGSAIELTGQCPGSVKAKSEIPQVAGSAADRGTRIHGWLEKYLKGDLIPPKEKLTGSALEEAQIGAAAGYEIKTIIQKLGMQLSDFQIERMLDFIPSADCLGCQIESNEKIDHSEGCYGYAGGTPDLDGYKAFGDMAIIDLKTGSHQVSAKDNKQLLFYACSLYNSLDEFTQATLNNCHLIIVQTQANSLDIEVRQHTLPVADLPAWNALFKMQIDRAEAEPDLRVAGDHCQAKYCDARSTCLEYRAWLDAETNGIFERAMAGDKETPRGKRLADTLNCLDKLKDFIKTVEADAINLMRAVPDAVPGWRLETGKGHRQWTDAKKAEAALKKAGLKLDEVAPRDLVSPAQAEKLLKSKGLPADLLPETTQPDTAPKLKRGEAANVFESFAAEEANAPKPQDASIQLAGSIP